MSPPILAAIATALVLSGVLVGVSGLRQVPADVSRPQRRPRRNLTAPQRRRMVMLAGGTVAGVVLAIITGWLILIILVPAAVVGVPYLLGSGDAEHAITRLEAMEEWTRGLAGVLTAGVSLEQAISSTVKSTKQSVKPEVQRLAARLQSRMPTDRAILMFADELDDVTGDKICAALILGAKQRTGIATLLEELARSVADDVRGRRTIANEQAKARDTARWVTIVTLVMFALLFFTGGYIEPYGTPLGQLVLIVLVGLFVATLLWMRRMTVAKPMPRFLGTGRAER